MSRMLTILGCGSSGGVPRVGSGWGACDPAEPKNRRRRCSIMIEQSQGAEKTSILVDTSPDLREQLLDAGTKRLDGVIITHEHADHTHGLDDLRPLVIHMRKRVDVYAGRHTGDLLRDRFGYCFVAPAGSSYPPILNEKRIANGEVIAISGPGGAMEFLPFDLVHGDITAFGLRFGKTAYTPDVSAISESSLPHLEGLDLWIIDALRDTPHPTHFSLSEALQWIGRMKPKNAILTNLHSDLDYARLRRELPANVAPAFDRMRLAIT